MNARNGLRRERRGPTARRCIVAYARRALLKLPSLQESEERAAPKTAATVWGHLNSLDDRAERRGQPVPTRLAADLASMRLL